MKPLLRARKRMPFSSDRELLLSLRRWSLGASVAWLLAAGACSGGGSDDGAGGTSGPGGSTGAGRGGNAGASAGVSGSPVGGSVSGAAGMGMAGSGAGAPSAGSTSAAGMSGSSGAAGSPAGAGGSSGASDAGAAGKGGAAGSAAGAGGTTAGSAGKGGSGGSAAGAGGSAAGSGGTGGDLCDVGVYSGSKPTPLSLSGTTGTHDPTILEENGVFYRYQTGNYIPVDKSTNLTTWQAAGTVYKSAYPAWIQTWWSQATGKAWGSENFFPWAPDVSRFNNQYHIYSSNSAIFGDNQSCISHLTTASLASGNWTDRGQILCTNGTEEYNAIDADVGFETNGTPWLAFGSFWDGIQLIRLNTDGSRNGTSIQRIAWASEIEAPVLFRRCGYYYLFVSFGLCCPNPRPIDSLTYRVAVGRSTSISGPYVDKNGMNMVNGGGTVIVQGDGATWQAAGHSDVFVSGNKIYHVYHAYRRSNGAPEVRIVELPFDEQGWPVAATGP